MNTNVAQKPAAADGRDVHFYRKAVRAVLKQAHPTVRPLITTDAKFFAPVPRQYRDAVHDTVEFLDRWRKMLNKAESHEGLLAELHREVRLALCSNFTHSETAHRVLDEAGFRPHLDAVAVSDAVGWRKPRPEIFDIAFELLG